MTFNDNASVGGNTARRRGGGIAVAGGGIAGLGALAVLLFQLFTGTDFSGLLGGGGVRNAAERVARSRTARPVPTRTRSDDCRLAAASLAIDQYWAENVQGYRAAAADHRRRLDQSTQCGTASNRPVRSTARPRSRSTSIRRSSRCCASSSTRPPGPLAQLYVLAHEYGHHVQQITGIMEQNPNNGTGADSNSVRTELQADCFAGAWVGGMTEQRTRTACPTCSRRRTQQINDALNAAQTVGDDHIQQESGGAVNPESWTHGSSEQRAALVRDRATSGGVERVRHVRGLREASL